MKKTIVLATIAALWFTLGSNALCADFSDSDISKLTEWVCHEMKENCEGVSLPVIIEMDKQSFVRKVKETKNFLPEVNKKEIIALYLPRVNTIFWLAGTEKFYLAHEIAHWVQYKVRRTPEYVESYARAVEIVKEFEEEAKGIGKAFMEYRKSRK